MKLLVLISITFATLSFAQGSSIEGTIEDAVCAEIDPFAVGDACIVFTTDEDSKQKLGLVYGDYDWARMFIGDDESETDVIGDFFKASGCTTLKSSDAIWVLKRYNPDYFYLSCDVDGFSYP